MKQERHILAFEKTKDDIFYIHRFSAPFDTWTDEMVPFEDILDENKNKPPLTFKTEAEAATALASVDNATLLICKATGLDKEIVKAGIKPRSLTIQLR